MTNINLDLDRYKRLIKFEFENGLKNYFDNSNDDTLYTSHIPLLDMMDLFNFSLTTKFLYHDIEEVDKNFKDYIIKYLEEKGFSFHENDDFFNTHYEISDYRNTLGGQ